MQVTGDKAYIRDVTLHCHQGTAQCNQRHVTLVHARTATSPVRQLISVIPVHTHAHDPISSLALF
jgi:hypothetical protein